VFGVQGVKNVKSGKVRCWQVEDSIRRTGWRIRSQKATHRSEILYSILTSVQQPILQYERLVKKEILVVSVGGDLTAIYCVTYRE